MRADAGADDAFRKLEQLHHEFFINLHDGAMVSWEAGRKKPKKREPHSTTGRGALGGAFWGMLFGLIFFVPLTGLAIGAASGALFGSLRDAGITDSVHRRRAGEGHPGHLGAVRADL